MSTYPALRDCIILKSTKLLGLSVMERPDRRIVLADDTDAVIMPAETWELIVQLSVRQAVKDAP